MDFLSLALSPLKNLRDRGGTKTTSCPKCGYKPGDAKRPTDLPGGINARLLLDSSPSPQILLSESNVIVYANQHAQRILRVTVIDAEKVDNDPEGELRDLDEDPLIGIQQAKEEEEGLDALKTSAGDLEGRTIDQLNIQLAHKEMRPWVNLVQVFENIKIHLSKREAKVSGNDADGADLYGEGPKYTSYDYYGEQERAGKSGGNNVEVDKILRDTAPIVIENENGTTFEATMYVALIDPYSTGTSYSSVSFIPGIGKDHKDATFSDQKSGHGDGSRPHVRKRDKLKAKMKGRNKENKPHETELIESFEEKLQTDTAEEVVRDNEYATGTSGEDMIKRIRRIKDLILDEMEYCFIALSPDGDIVITNSATKTILGQETLQASIGEGFEWIARLDIWRPDFSERLPFEEWALNKLITHHKPLSQVIGLYAGDFPLVVELRGTCIWENSEKEEGLLAALAIVVNQTEWFEKERAMKAAKMKQQSLLSNISSDLRAPIAGMVGLLEMLYETDGLNDAQKRHIEGVFGSVNSLMLVINDVIDFRSIENGEAKVENSAFVLQDLVRELESIFKGISAAHKGVGFEVDATGIKTSVPEEQKRLVLVGDDTKMKRIAVNILSNAFKYTTRGKVKLSVSIENAQASTVDVRFSIEDTGIGISKEDRLRIFVPLTQMSSQDATDLAQGKSSGTGFGLSIAQQYTELLGGEIGCDSTINAGSTFWFKIPVGRPAPDAEIDLEQKEPTLAKNMGLVLSRQELAGSEESMKSKSKKHKQKVRINIAGTNVMLVEDNWPQQMVMQRRLNLLGCRVVTAPNGQNCLELLKSAESEIDMIFMDLQMPLLNGFEATKQIRTDPTLTKWRNLPILGLTATDLPENKRKAEECGLTELTIKPVDEAKAREFIEKVMDPVQVGARRRSLAALPRVMSF